MRVRSEADSPRPFVVAGMMVVWLALLLAGGPIEAAAMSDAVRLRTLHSRHYTIHTNLTAQEAGVFSRHMDLVFDQYDERFSIFRSGRRRPMDLYLFRTQQQYERFLQKNGIGSLNTGGIFVFQPGLKGLATWTQNKPRSRTFAVLQHEGFHQFAYEAIGSTLPTWVNEGLAQFFEDGIIVRTHMILGQRNGRRIKAVKTALKNGTAIDFDHMLNMTDRQWKQTVSASERRASLMYDQAWSMAYYMVRGKNRKREEAFVKYLKLLSERRKPTEAFESVFGRNTMAFYEDWVRFALTVEPDPLNTAVSRIEFLGQGLAYLHERHHRIPQSFGELKRILQGMNFRLHVCSHGGVEQLTAMDEENYSFWRDNGTQGKFRLLKSIGHGLPPRITAEGLNPIPTLVWSRDAEGQLVQDVEYK